MTPKYKGNRKNLQPKTVRIGVLEAQASRNRYLIEQLEKNLAEIQAEIEILKAKDSNGSVDKKKCKYCGKEFKDLSRHKCKLKPKSKAKEHA